MASLKDLAAVTARLDRLTTELHSELTERSIDFRKMVDLADDIGAQTDRLAAAFTSMADALDTSLDGSDADQAGRDAEASDGEQDE